LKTRSPVKAIVFDAPGPPHVLRVEEVPVPEPGDGEVLIEVHAAGVNGADLNMRRGASVASPEGGRPGLEVFGTITEVGRGCTAEQSPSGTLWSPGDRVCALLSGGGYAQYAVAPVEQCLPPPANLDPDACAGVLETAATVWDNVFIRGRLRSDEVLLVHGGASGIGTTAIQLAQARGARVFATAGSEEKCRTARQLGAEAAFNYRTEDFGPLVVERAGGADVILDVAGATYLERNLQALKAEGRLVVIGVSTGRIGPLDLGLLMARRATIMGSVLKTRSREAKRELLSQVWREVWPLYASSRMRVIVGSVLPLADAAGAHAAIEAGQVIGKAILRCQ
jgi:putative PIG3 family NAD(P)H quinone oxidoreductase